MPSKPNILIVGPPGSGKSSSLETLITSPRAKDIALFDFEMKGYPFIFNEPEQDKLGMFVETQDYFAADAAFKKFALDPNLKIGIIDSMGAYLKVAREHFKTTKTGWDVWTAYNAKIMNVINVFKQSNKILVAFIHDEIIQMDTPEGGKVSRVRAFVQGREYEGKLEGEFLIALAAEPYKDGQVWKRRFRTNTNGLDLSKTPPWLKLPEHMPNNLLPILEKFYESGTIVSTTAPKG